jgi:hypothetical protein
MNGAVRRGAALMLVLLGAVGCDRVFTATPEERLGLLRELVRARMVARDTLRIDACSIDRFMQGVPGWRDSLVIAERALIEDVKPCAAEVAPIPGRFVLTSWYRNWTGEYVIRGSTTLFDEGYRFSDGIFVGRDTEEEHATFGAAKTAASVIDSASALKADSVTLEKVEELRQAGVLFNTLPDSARDTTGAAKPPDVRP